MYIPEVVEARFIDLILIKNQSWDSGMSDQPIIIAYYSLAGISVLCSGFVIATLWFYGSLKTSATRLLMMLHVTLICEEVTALPYVYNTVPDLCEAVAFLHFYFGLASIMAIGFLVISYRYHFFLDSIGVNRFIQNWALYTIGIFPMITLLPFSTRAYGTNKGPWCSISGGKEDHTWTFSIFYIWVWLVLFFSLVWMVVTMIQIYKIDKTSGHRLFSTVGMYSMISIVTWIPRTVEQALHFTRGDLNSTEWEYSYIPLYIAGILYTLVFLTEKKALILFDRAFHHDIDERAGSSFSWEGSDLRFTNPSISDEQQSSGGSGMSRRALSMAERSGTKASIRSPLTMSPEGASAFERDQRDSSFVWPSALP